MKLIFDKHRGIYFAEEAGTPVETPAGVRVDVRGMRHVFYFNSSTAGDRGVYGLATQGPGKSSKIGPSVDGSIWDVVKVIDVSDAAAEVVRRIKW